MGKVKQFIISLRNHKEQINNVVPYFLMAYFCLICFPYIFARISILNSAFTNSVGAFIFRFGFLALYTLFGIILMISNGLKVNWCVLIGISVLLLLFIINIFISPNEIIYYSFYFTGKIALNNHTLGLYIKLVHIARFGGDLVFFFFLISAYPFAFKNRNQFTYVVIPAVVIATIGLFYTIIFERSTIEYILSGGNAEKLVSIFHSKNAYGIFLFNGAAAASFIFFADSRRWTKFIAILIPPFLVMAFLANCKLAALCIIILLILDYVYVVFRYIKTKPFISYSLIGFIIVLFVGIILVFSIPSLHSSGIVAKIYDKIIEVISKIDISSFIGRTREWSLVPRMTNGIFMWIGFSTPAGYELITSYTSINGSATIAVYDLHNAYIDFYAYHGIIGCVILGLLYIYVGYLIYKLFKKDKRMALLVTMIFFVSILFGFAETYRLFISMSANTFALNIMTLGILLFELKDDNTVFRPNICFKKKKELEVINNA